MDDTELDNWEEEFVPIPSPSRNFIDLFMDFSGKSEIPRHWHLWACLSLLASTVSDRIWIQRNARWRIYPNLYIFLIGPSGSGKDKAIDVAVELLVGMDIINFWCGRATREFFIDMLKDSPTGFTNPKMYFVTPELGSSLRPGDRGFELISFMTELYTKRVHDEGTRSLGHIRITNACLNWLAGTTEEWLKRSVPQDSIEGGFFARVLPIRGERDYSLRYPEMLLPKNYEEIKVDLQGRVRDLTWLEGAFTFSLEAQEAHDAWYMSTTVPENEKLIPSFNRADELICRLSLLFRIAELERPAPVEEPWIIDSPTISVGNFTEALETWSAVMHYDMPEIQKLAGGSKETVDVDLVERYIKKAGVILHSLLLQRLSSYGINEKRLRGAIETLRSREQVEPVVLEGKAGRERRGWRWILGDSTV